MAFNNVLLQQRGPTASWAVRTLIRTRELGQELPAGNGDDPLALLGNIEITSSSPDKETSGNTGASAAKYNDNL